MRYITGGTGLTVRMDNPDLPWWDKKVRRALALAVNNQEVADEYYDGNAELLTYPVLPDPEYGGMYTPLEELPESTRELYGYNPEKAKQLLAEAGYPDGFAAKVVCYNTGVDALSIIKAYWADIDVDLQIDVREYAVFQGILSRSKHEEMIYGIPSLAGLASKFSNFYGPGNLNISRINTTYVDQVCQETIEAMDALGLEFYTNREKYDAIIKKAALHILEESWSIPLPGTYTYKFWPSWVKDYRGEGNVGYLNGYIWLNYIWIDQDLKEEMTGKR
jgi:peptide/nickel transport system substrate-binding protein